MNAVGAFCVGMIAGTNRNHNKPGSERQVRTGEACWFQASAAEETQGPEITPLVRGYIAIVRYNGLLGGLKQQKQRNFASKKYFHFVVAFVVTIGYICIQKGNDNNEDKMLYFADDAKEVKIEKINKAIEYVLSVLNNQLPSWERKEYYGVLCDYRAELAEVMK